MYVHMHMTFRLHACIYFSNDYERNAFVDGNYYHALFSSQYLLHRSTISILDWGKHSESHSREDFYYYQRVR